MLEQQLRKQKVDNVKALLDSHDNCWCSSPPLSRPARARGRARQSKSRYPPAARQTSLRGGYLQDCILRDYENTKSLVPSYKGANSLLPGHILAHARGPLLVGFGDPDEQLELKRARIWGGGISNLDRPFYLLLKNDDKSARIANAVAERLNLMFQDDVRAQRLIQQSQRLLLLDNVTRELNEKQDRGSGSSRNGQGDQTRSLSTCASLMPIVTIRSAICASRV